MEKGRKNMLIAAGAAFAGGVAVTLTVLALAFCPAKRHGMWHGGWHRDMPRAEMRLPTRHHPEGRFDGERPREWKYRADRGDAPRRFGHPGFHPERALKHRFAEKLQLTDEQKAQIEQFRKEDMAQMEPLFKQMDDLRAKADKLREENKARFESVLTDEQKEILAAMHERRAQIRERRAEMREHRAEMKERQAEVREHRAEMQERRVPADGQRDVYGKKQLEKTQPAGEETVSAE